MNRQIVKLFAFVVVLFGVLIGFTSYWSVFDAKALKDNPANRRPLFEQQQIKRGRILAADGSMIARSVAIGHGSNLRYVRRYPEGSLYGHPIGYSFEEQGQSEFEQSHNEELVGSSSEFGSILDQLTGHNQEGDDVVTNLDPAAQRVALNDLQAAGSGAVVAIEPRTGRVRAMASSPPYDPNRVPYDLAKLNTNPDTPLVDRATQGQYPPGSTFKVVTAAAGLNSGTITPETTINAPGSIEVQGQPLQNDYNQSFGPISLDTALTYSVNTWFGQLGQRIGESTLFNYMDRFGFNATPAIDLPEDQVYKSGVFEEEKLLGPGDPVDLARIAIGQERLRVTPLQMAEVAAAVANGGRLMKPQIWSRVVEPRRARRQAPPAVRIQPADQRQDRRRADHRDGRRGQRRHRHQRGDPRRRRRRQDGHRRNPVQQILRRRNGREPGLVHRLRPGQEPEDRDRRHGRMHDEVRQRRGGADLPRRGGNDPAWEMTR